MSMVIFRGSPNKKEVALIFDDGPNPFITPKLLKVLSDKDVPANFFLIGMRAEQSPEIARQIAEAGHEIGNHTYTHKRLANVLSEQGEQAVVDEVIKGRDAIAKASGLENDQITYLRPPYLSWSDAVAEVIKPIYGDNIVSSGLAIGDYDWDSDHIWNQQDAVTINTQAKSIADAWIKVIENGTLLGFHDSSEHNLPGNKQYDNWMNRALPTLAATPQIIDYLLENSYKITRLSDMELVKESSANE
ncbi:MAG TPA: polysaccharide deacetylase family protein [Candidatus Dormibacteraeota bacterium]|nr:polysaccharide deacetylase family protein [Candidatus Dormibacteraeota bacterium]